MHANLAGMVAAVDLQLTNKSLKQLEDGLICCSDTVLCQDVHIGVLGCPYLTLEAI